MMPTKKETKKTETDKPFPIILDKDIQEKTNAKSKKYQNNFDISILITLFVNKR